MELTSLTALSPLDGRYLDKLSKLSSIFSEMALMKNRLFIEIEWLKFLCAVLPGQGKLNAQDTLFLDNVVKNFNEADAKRIKEIEHTTKHDLKAVEYFIKEHLKSHPRLSQLVELIHFACTSEDINNLAYALMVKSGLVVLTQQLDGLYAVLVEKAHRYATLAMLSHTHGQPATPTTLGKEFANFAYRLKRQLQQLNTIEMLGKINGAVGNYNAHHVAYPEMNWPQLCQKFVEQLGLVFNPYTTQIEPHDALAEIAHNLSRINTVLLDLSKDMWAYISLRYFKQQLRADEVGSSTMPHKINPIDFENAEGNLGIANSLLTHLAAKLPISRLQRDLSDSTVLRNMGVAFGHSLIAYQALSAGFLKCEVNAELMTAELDEHVEVLAEALQTVMRRYNIATPYEKLKFLTQGKRVTALELHAFIESLTLEPEIKTRLKALTPQSYIGFAASLAQNIT